MSSKRSYPRTQRFLLLLQLGGDIFFCFVGLNAGYWLRFHSAIRHVGVEPDSPSYPVYLPLLLLGSAFLVGSYNYLGLYDARLLLRPFRSASIILRSTFFWFLLFLSTSLIFKFEPPISRIFVAFSSITSFGVMLAWRYGFYRWLAASHLSERLTQRVALIGWSDDAAKLVQAISADRGHPYDIYGVVLTLTESNPPLGILNRPPLGHLTDLEQIFDQHLIDIAVVVDPDMPRNTMLEIVGLCERKYVAFKMIPSFFQTFVSNLHMQTISGVPILGVEQLRILGFSAVITKRTMDIVGALVGLILSAPIIAVLAFLVKRESPGPVIYRQTRTGRNGQPFTIYKLRSMRIDAEKDTGALWAVSGDPRRLKIGAFMREWNLDELPQFWNILIGDMSLIGPRPERPELITQFEIKIPHYNPRHEVRPGLTGWAQVNGLRGSTSLSERIRYDL